MPCLHDIALRTSDPDAHLHVHVVLAVALAPLLLTHGQRILNRLEHIGKKTSTQTWGCMEHKVQSTCLAKQACQVLGNCLYPGCQACIEPLIGDVHGSSKALPPEPHASATHLCHICDVPGVDQDGPCAQGLRSACLQK